MSTVERELSDVHYPWTMICTMQAFIFVGQVHRDGDLIVVENCYNVRRYSLNTKDGFGGLALRTPIKDNDILDACPTTTIGVFAVVNHQHIPDQAGWSKWHASQVAPTRKRGAK